MMMIQTMKRMHKLCKYERIKFPNFYYNIS